MKGARQSAIAADRRTSRRGNGARDVSIFDADLLFVYNLPLPYIAVWGFPPYVLYGQRSAYFQKWTGGGNSTLLFQVPPIPPFIYYYLS